MLRISKHIEDGPRARLELEGKLDETRVHLLETECQKLIAAGRSVELDLACLRFADGAGVRALKQLRARGIRIVALTRLVERLLA